MTDSYQLQTLFSDIYFVQNNSFFWLATTLCLLFMYYHCTTTSHKPILTFFPLFSMPPFHFLHSDLYFSEFLPFHVSLLCDNLGQSFTACTSILRIPPHTPSSIPLPFVSYVTTKELANKSLLPPGPYSTLTSNTKFSNDCLPLRWERNISRDTIEVQK